MLGGGRLPYFAAPLFSSPPSRPSSLLPVDFVIGDIDVCANSSVISVISFRDLERASAFSGYCFWV
jgi:hypothetical protein